MIGQKSTINKKILKKKSEIKTGQKMSEILRGLQRKIIGPKKQGQKGGVSLTPPNLRVPPNY